MPSYLSANFSGQCAQGLKNLFDTLSRPITIYKTPDKTYIGEPANFNNAFGQNQPNALFSTTPVSGVFQARVLYPKDEIWKDPNTSARGDNPMPDLKTMLQRGQVRIMLEQDGADFIAGSPRIQLDNKDFRLLSDNRPHKLFGRNVFLFLLEQVT